MCWKVAMRGARKPERIKVRLAQINAAKPLWPLRKRCESVRTQEHATQSPPMTLIRGDDVVYQLNPVHRCQV